MRDLPCSTVYVRWLTSKSQSQLVFKIHIFPGHLFVDEFQHCNLAVTFESEYEIFSLLESGQFWPISIQNLNNFYHIFSEYPCLYFLYMYNDAASYALELSCLFYISAFQRPSLKYT